MEQALQTKEHFDLYGLRFESDKATIPADAQSLLDDIATALKNFPDWNLRIVGHTDATADPQHNQALSLEYLAKEGKGLAKKVHPVPLAIDREIARLKLQSMGVTIDLLTDEQNS